MWSAPKPRSDRGRLALRATTRCPARRVYGVTMPAAEGPLGGWSDHILLLPGTHLLPLPAGLGWRAFLATGCGMPTALHAVTLAEIPTAVEGKLIAPAQHRRGAVDHRRRDAKESPCPPG